MPLSNKIKGAGQLSTSAMEILILVYQSEYNLDWNSAKHS